MLKISILFYLMFGLCLNQSVLTIPTFDEYIIKFNKTYSSDTQKASRKVLYEARTALFSKINDYTPSVNNLTDWETGQLNKLLGLKTLTNQTGKAAPATVSSAPTSLNWNAQGKTTSVKNQGGCGSCWAFASTAYAESKMLIDDRYKQIDLAEQKLLQCTSNSSCDGGYLEYAMDSVASTIPFEAIFHYSPAFEYPVICSFMGVEIGKTAESYYNLTDDQIIALLQERPVAVAVSATGWENYGSGVFKCGATDSINHAVLLVGYQPNYWVLKNSWGTDWGESGYIKVTRTPLINCKIGSAVYRTFQWHLASFLMVFIFLGLL